ncbi:hypothetical protein J6590_099061 [Homalodisca vitripennis]|nr:hypothetical protein J6590_099061 [Homalodisca vitripennis]
MDVAKLRYLLGTVTGRVVLGDREKHRFFCAVEVLSDFSACSISTHPRPVASLKLYFMERMIATGAPYISDLAGIVRGTSDMIVR